MPIGFHDAYVAAPSQKAAAEAWGTDTSVFARKEAELVTDPALTEAALASPGKVIKRLRGSADEQIAALGTHEGADAGKPKHGPAKAAAKAKPRPSRAALEKAEQELAAAEARHSEERADLAAREAELARERKAIEAKQREEEQRLERKREAAEERYDEAIRRWRSER